LKGLKVFKMFHILTF